MEIRRNWLAPSASSVIAIGNFDGVHLGHKALLKQAKNASRERELQLCALTFEPHPLVFLRPKAAPFRVLDLRSKLAALADEGVDVVRIMSFTKSLASMEAAEFTAKMLRSLKMSALVVGSDFRFGRERKGDIAMLEKLSSKQEFELIVIKNCESEQGQRVSSKLLRSTLADGDFAAAAKLLGRAYSFGGRVHRGNQIGSTLGMPTANLRFGGTPPLHGVYAARAYLEDECHNAALAIGNRPAVGGEKLSIEAHLIGYCGDLYGRYMKIEPVAKLRDEENFPDLQSLAAAMRKDVLDCERILVKS